MASTRRPSMKGRDSHGREVSLLNITNTNNNINTTEQAPSPVSYTQSRPQRPTVTPLQQHYNLFGEISYATQPASQSPHMMMRTNSSQSIASNASVPSLFRSDSYGSQTTNEARSPVTPTLPTLPTFSTSRLYGNHQIPIQGGKDYHQSERDPLESFPQPNLQPMIQSYSQEHSYYEDTYQGIAERGTGKRYPCRFADTYQCLKTFTTSGHASRHAKIHTAEKMVQCSYNGCPKKFTRSDNMKQHLDTHYKDKPRSSSTTLTPSGRANGRSPLTRNSGVQKRPYSSPLMDSMRSPGPIARMISSNIPPPNLQNSNYQYQYTPSENAPQPSIPATQPAFQNLPTRSRSPTSPLHLLADAALI